MCCRLAKAGIVAGGAGDWNRGDIRRRSMRPDYPAKRGLSAPLAANPLTFTRRTISRTGTTSTAHSNNTRMPSLPIALAWTGMRQILTTTTYRVDLSPNPHYVVSVGAGLAVGLKGKPV